MAAAHDVFLMSLFCGPHTAVYCITASIQFFLNQDSDAERHIFHPGDRLKPREIREVRLVSRRTAERRKPRDP